MTDVLHILHPLQRHTVVPYMWRVRCTCGWTAFAFNEVRAKAAGDNHISEEVPFPDLDIEPEPGSGADRAKKNT